MSYPHPMIRLALLAAFGASLVACSDRNDAGTPAGPPRTDVGDTFVVTSTNRLLSFALATPGAPRTAVAISDLPAGEKIVDLDARPASAVEGSTTPRFYALGSTGALYALDTVTGLATSVGTPIAPTAGAAYAIDFNPLVDLLRMVSSTGQNLRVAPATGALAATDTPLTFGGSPQLDVSGIAYSNDFADGCTTTLYYVDPATDQLLTTAAPNGGVLTAVGDLGVDATAVGGLDLVGGSGNALALLTVGGTPGLYFINLATGAATLRTPVTGLTAGETPVALASTIVDDGRTTGNMVATTASGKLITFNRADPTRTCTTADIAILDDNGDPIDGLTVMGIDVRQSDGTLYGLVDDGSVVALDAGTGEGFIVLPGLLTDTGAPTPTELALDGANFGIDFDPTADLLRIVSDTGQNLSVDLSGADASNTIVDTPLAQTGVSGAAYTSGDPALTPPVAPQLYYIKADTDQLFTTADPASGVLTAVGVLGVDLGAVNGFDIEGSGGAAYIAADAAGEGSSRVYSVDLATGAATALGAGLLGAGSASGAQQVTGLAVLAP